MKWAFSISSLTYEQYDLDVRDDGTFRMAVGFSDAAGWAGGFEVSGRWTRTGDELAFEIRERSSQYGTDALTTATVSGEHLDVLGIGLFWKA